MFLIGAPVTADPAKRVVVSSVVARRVVSGYCPFDWETQTHYCARSEEKVGGYFKRWRRVL